MIAYSSLIIAGTIFLVGLVQCSPPFLATSILDDQIAQLEPLASAFDAEKYLAKQRAYRLPSNVIPQSYTINLVPYMSGDFKFTGDVNIKVLIAEETSFILLHSHKLDILSVKVLQEESEEIESRYVLVPVTQMLNISLDRELKSESTCIISIEFQGVLNDDLVGFYRSRYESKGETKWAATTQFEATYARMAFPCFDEPRFRSKFTISIARYEQYRTISNMPVKDTSFPIPSLENRVIDTFHTTPAMPTYLVAFTISDFHFIANDIEKFRVWSREEALHDGEYALAEVEGLYKHMYNYTNIDYMLPKLDLAAIPDFDAGAMENWGLTTYRETLLLYNNETRSTKCKEDVSSVVAHELAHQWFGNYITITWWDYLWLNEGFATFYQYFLINEMNSHWRIMERMIVQSTHYALGIDGISVHHPLNALVNTPSEIASLFDGITYHKGAALIHMIENFFGYLDFRNTIRVYLKIRYEDGELTTPQDLFDVMEFCRLMFKIRMPLGLNLHMVFESFTNQVGYPLLTVTRHTGTNGIDIKIRQAPYRSPRSVEEIPDQTWVIPISCAGRRQFHMDNVEVEFWHYTNDEITLEDRVEEKEWLICNVQQTGYYRVNYDKENWNLIKDQLLVAPEEIHPINRAQIMDDSFTFALDEKLSFPIVINILSYLKYETDAIPWYTGLQKLQILYSQYEATALEVDLKKFVRDMLTMYFDWVGFDEKPKHDHSTNDLRNTLTRVSCDFDVSDCVTKASKLYYGTDNLGKISGDVLEAVLCTAMNHNSTMSTWKRLWKFYKDTNIAVEKETVLMAVGCASNEEIHKKYLLKLIDEKDIDIRSQNFGHVFKSMLRYYRGVTSTLKFIKETIPNISKHKRARNVFLQLLNRMKSAVKSNEHVNILEGAIEEAEKLDQEKYGDITNSLRRTKKQALMNIRENERRRPELTTALSNYAKRSRPSPDKSSATYNSVSVIFSLCLLAITFFEKKFY